MAATKSGKGKSKVVNIKVPLQVEMSADRTELGKTGRLQPGISQDSLATLISSVLMILMILNQCSEPKSGGIGP